MNKSCKRQNFDLQVMKQNFPKYGVSTGKQ